MKKSGRAEYDAFHDDVKTIDGFTFRPVPDDEIRALINQKTSRSVTVLASLAAVVLIGLMIFFVAKVRNDSGINQIDMLTGDDKTIFLYNGKEIDGSIRDEVILFERSYNGKAAYAVDEELDIYCITKDGIEKFGKDVNYSAEISRDGDFIFYVNEDYDGFIYDVKKNKSKEIASDVEALSVVFSPDGKTLFYNELNTGDLYIYEGKEPEKFDSGVRCVGVSNNAKHVYAVDYVAYPEYDDDFERPDADDYEEYEDYKKAYDKYEEYQQEYEKLLEEYQEFDATDVALYYYPSGNADKAEKLEKHAYSKKITYNEDFSQIVFFNADGETFFSEKGEDPMRISKEMISPCLSENFYYISNSQVTVILDEKLLDRKYTGFDDDWYLSMYYVDKNGETDRIEKAVKNSYVAENNQKSFWIDEDGDIYYSGKKNGSDAERIAKDAVNVAVERDFSGAYYIDEDDKLYYVDKKGNSEKIDKDVTDFWSAPDGGIYYLDDDDNLYYAKKTKTEKIDSDVSYVVSGMNSAVYCKDADKNCIGDIYASENGDEKFGDKIKEYGHWYYTEY